MRSAAGADRDATARIWFEGWRATGPAAGPHASRAGLRARVDRELAAGQQAVLALVGGEVIGFVALRPADAELDQLFAAPEKTGRGGGAALFARARRVTPPFRLATHAANVRARRLHERPWPRRARDAAHPTLGHPVRIYRFAGR